MIRTKKSLSSTEMKVLNTAELDAATGAGFVIIRDWRDLGIPADWLNPTLNPGNILIPGNINVGTP